MLTMIPVYRRITKFEHVCPDDLLRNIMTIEDLCKILNDNIKSRNNIIHP